MKSRRAANRGLLPVSCTPAKNRRSRLLVESIECRLNPAPDLLITTTFNGATTGPGGTIVYLVNLQNVGTSDATNVMISETVPANTTFNALASDADWNSAGTAWGPIGIISPGDSMTIPYAVNVN